jgi:prepilin-type N-terminal cleavage/methylation domain-containing protein
MVREVLPIKMPMRAIENRVRRLPRWATACRALVRDERGFTLVEILGSMVIMGVVLGGITATLASATGLEADLGTRFQSQQAARQALTKFRTEVHCASGVTPSSGTAASVTLTLPTGCTTGSGSVTWCAVANGNRSDLWRIPGTTCTTAAAGASRWGQGLTTSTPFTPDGSVHAPAVLPSVAVTFSFNTGKHTYVLADTIYLRNGTRS